MLRLWTGLCVLHQQRMSRGLKKKQLILELSANSVLFMSNVIQCHVRKQRFSSKILDCYFLKTKTSFKSSLNQALRIIERKHEELSVPQTMNKLPFIKCFEITNRENPRDADIELEENHDFVAYISSYHRRRSILPPNEILNSPHGEYRLVYLVTNENDSEFVSITSIAKTGGTYPNKAGQ